jgi:hypothetical protein
MPGGAHDRAAYADTPQPLRDRKLPEIGGRRPIT